MRKLFNLLLLLLTGTQAVFSQESAKTQIKFGGFVQALSLYEFGGVIASHDYVVSNLPVPDRWDQQNRFGIDASATRFNADLTHQTSSIGAIRVFAEADFRGASNVLRLRHAYISLLGITAGQTWTFMYDADATAPTIDQQGVNSRSFFRTPLLGYIHKIGAKTSLGISLEMPNARITAANNIVAVNQSVPDIPVFIQYKTTAGHVKLAGVVRNIGYGNNAEEKIRFKQGWGVLLSGSLKPFSAITLHGQGIYGRGIARYINDLAAQSLDLLPDYSNPDKADVQNMFGASVGLRADVSNKVYLSSNFGVAQLNENERYVIDSDYKSSKYFSGTLFWKAYPNLLFAAEYLYGYRKNINGDYGDANRIQAMLRYNF
jgi:hypothetical protein